MPAGIASIAALPRMYWGAAICVRIATFPEPAFERRDCPCEPWLEPAA